LDEAGNVILEQSLPITPKGIHQVFRNLAGVYSGGKFVVSKAGEAYYARAAGQIENSG
jgi:hypothetical protein